MRALAQQRARVAVGVEKLGEALERDQADDDERPVHGSGSRVDKLEARGEAGAERGHQHAAAGRRHRASARARRAPSPPTCCRNRASIARASAERASAQTERLFERVEHLGAAGMADEAVDIGERRDRGGGGNPRSTSRRSRCTSAGMSREKSALSPSSATSQPMMSSDCGQVYSPPCPSAGPSAVAGNHRRRGAVAEEGGGDDVALGEIAMAEAQRAKLDDEEQHARCRARRARDRRRAHRPSTPPAQPRPKIGRRRTSLPQRAGG